MAPMQTEREQPLRTPGPDTTGSGPVAAQPGVRRSLRCGPDGRGTNHLERTGPAGAAAAAAAIVAAPALAAVAGMVDPAGPVQGHAVILQAMGD
jgi:hypothetical protein